MKFQALRGSFSSLALLLCLLSPGLALAVCSESENAALDAAKVEVDAMTAVLLNIDSSISAQEESESALPRSAAHEQARGTFFNARARVPRFEMHSRAYAAALRSQYCHPALNSNAGAMAQEFITAIHARVLRAEQNFNRLTPLARAEDRGMQIVAERRNRFREIDARVREPLLGPRW